ncbi:MAG: ABC transporter substrate-binding protein [Candidatus Caldarchaeum sp.]|nr:ABC transporter substrate-binding protein [Candidatus Caldarchaeum sp.]
MRVVSLVPSATDILQALGASDEVVATTYACSLNGKPVVVTPLLKTDGLPSVEVDRLVSLAKSSDKPLYYLDVETIRRLSPDLIVAQGVCEVCAVSTRTSEEKLRQIAPVVELNPSAVNDILNDIIFLGKLLKREHEAHEIVAGISETLNWIRRSTESLPKPRVAFMEWLFPPFCSGHWVPELVEIAGGVDLGVKGVHSRRVEPSEIMEHGPEILIAGPCGYGLDRSYEELRQFLQQPWTACLKAVQQKNLYAVDADRYFSRHGPQIAQAALVLAEIIHPEKFSGKAPEKSFKKY